MASRLYYRTTREGLDGILAEGFRDGDEEPETGEPLRGVWFSRRLDAWGERGPHLVEVLLDATEAGLQPYAKEMVADEVWDDAVGDFVPCDSAEVERSTWYKIPADFVNARGKARHVPPEEARLLEAGILDVGDDTEPPSGR